MAMKPAFVKNAEDQWVPLFITRDDQKVPAFFDDESEVPCHQQCCGEVSFEDCEACVDALTGVNLTFSGPSSIPCDFGADQIWYPINDSFALTNVVPFPPFGEKHFDITLGGGSPCDDDGVLFAEQPAVPPGTFHRRGYIYHILARVDCIDQFTAPKIRVRLSMSAVWWEKDDSPFCGGTSGFGTEVLPPMVYERDWDEVCNQQLPLLATRSDGDGACSPATWDLDGEVGLIW